MPIFPVPAVTTPTTVTCSALIKSVFANPVKFAPLPTKPVAVTTPVTLAPSGKLGLAQPLPDKLVTFIVDIYRSPICRTSITRVLPTPTVIPTPDFTVIVGMVLTTIEL